MAKKYIFMRVPKEVHLNLIKGKNILQGQLQKFAGKNIKLTMPKYLNVLQKSREDFLGIVPYNYNKVVKLVKKGRGYYE